MFTRGGSPHGFDCSVTPHLSVGGFRPPAGTALTRGLEPRLASEGRGVLQVVEGRSVGSPYPCDYAARMPMHASLSPVVLPLVALSRNGPIKAWLAARSSGWG